MYSWKVGFDPQQTYFISFFLAIILPNLLKPSHHKIWMIKYYK